MLVQVIAEYFKYKFVHSIIILACWSPLDQIKFMRQINGYGYLVTVTCDTSILLHRQSDVQGIVYFKQSNHNILEKITPDTFSYNYKWVIVDDALPEAMHSVRYDAEIVLLHSNFTRKNDTIFLEDIYIHPAEGASLKPWGYWRPTSGLVITNDRDRILRRSDLKGFPLRIAAPMGQYADGWYNGSYVEYVEDETLTELDAGIRCGYGACKLLIDALNATDDIIQTLLWGATVHNSSMTLMLGYGNADLSGGILRILHNRVTIMDYTMPIWPFSVGFTYLAERESSSNMYVEPFTAGVWVTCFVIGVILAIAQRVTSRSQEEKDGSYFAVLATWLQQDASAVPNGVSGRWTFIVLSVCAMLVHAYYTSSIVSALMSSGRSGPDSLRSLADSKYAIASEDYDYMRYMMFSAETNWDDLEYLKRKKMTSKFYQELDRGVELIAEGNTAFHSEYNQIFPHFKTFTDDQICKLQHVDTIPETMTWITTTKNGQWTNTFRLTGAWLHEVGLAKRLMSRLQALRPPCRSALLAERVTFADVAPLLTLTAFGGFLSIVLLLIEIIFAKRKTKPQRNNIDVVVASENFEYTG